MSDTASGDPRIVYFWRNLATNVCLEGMWGFAMACTSLVTVVAVLLRELGAPAIVIGALPATAMVSAVISEIPGALLFRRLKRRKWPFILALLPTGALWVAAGLAVRGMGHARPSLAIGLVIAFLGVSSLAAGLIYPAWADFLNRMYPPSRRGRALGAMGLSLSVMMLLGGLYAVAVLRRWPGPSGFGMLFIVAGALMLLGSIAYAPVVEAELEPGRPFDLRRALSLLLSRGSPWRPLVLTRWAIEVSRASLVFASLLMLARFDLPASTAGILSFLMAGGQALASPLAGWVGDRSGHKTAVLIMSVLVPAGTLLVLAGHHPWLAFAGFVLLGTMGAGDMAFMNLTIETVPEDDKNMHLAMVDTCMVPPRLVAPLVAGAVAQLASPAIALGVGVALQVGVVWVVARFLVEPRRHAPHLAPAPFRPE